MMFRKCPKCKKRRSLTRHSKTGNHQPPFKPLCRDCHDEEDGMNPQKIKMNKKVQKGTPYGKYKKK